MSVPAHAYWIGSDHPFDLHEAYVNFRRDVELVAVPAKAELWITADSRYKLWVNGVFIGRGPARCWPQAQQYDVIDATSHLRKGLNAIAVQVYSPGYSHFAYVHRGACGLLAGLIIDGQDACVTDTDWRVQRDRSWREDVPRVSIYGSGVERRDLVLERNWRTAAVEGAEWKTPRMVAPASGTIWRELAERDVPLLRETAETLRTPWRFMRASAGATDDDPHQALRMLWQQGRIEPAPPSGSPIQLAAGETVLWAFDLGASCVCHGSVEVIGALGGERVLISYAEKRRGGDLVLSDPATYCRMRPTDDFLLRPGDNTVEPFSQRGGRYLIFTITAHRAVAVGATFRVHRTSYPLARHRTVAPADAALARIAQMCEHTLTACLQDGFVDSVWRESSQWLGDCVTEAFALAAISDDLRPLRRVLTMAAEGAYSDGVLPSVLPGEVHAYTVVDYNFSWVELLAMYARHPKAAVGDRLSFVHSMTPALAMLLASFDRHDANGGLIHSQPGRRLFLDWSPMDRSEPNLTYNGRYLYALNLAAELASELGMHGMAATWTARAGTLRKAIRSRLHPEGTWRESPSGPPASQLGLALLILTGVVEGAEALALADVIISRSLDLDDSHGPGTLVLASPFMHHYIFLALDRLDRRDAILAIIRARWGRWAEAGEPTTWENWAVDFPDGSVCHGFSAHPLGWIARCLPADRTPTE
jgi:hypothetical protein